MAFAMARRPSATGGKTDATGDKLFALNAVGSCTMPSSVRSPPSLTRGCPPGIWIAFILFSRVLATGHPL
ncbi:hypothetical protein ALQ13_200084 [Pseudomonas savastanoi pv. glycinea]|nr:hypothetical protein ALQ13_200084 [Pseudomonas savastanoi pv. glycinea]